MASNERNSQTIRFLLNGESVALNGVETTRSVLQLLREKLRCVGTKEGCAEGDCGACTVVLAELEGDELRIRAVNACIQFAPTLDGKALYTVEYLRQGDGALHPAQQAMVDCHGSQCGFCTPGFVMSLWGQYVEHQANGTRPTRTELGNTLTGNLCRCTGYKPILDAGEQMFELPSVEFDRAALTTALKSLRRQESLVYSDGGSSYYAPQSLAELTRLRAEHPQATLLAGCTDVGLWVNKQLRDLGEIIYLGEVTELKQLQEVEGAVRIGAGVTLTDAYEALAAHYPEAREMWERFASLPIRNAGTLGGNIANGSPIGDSMPWLIAVGARVALRNQKGSRWMPLEDLYVDYMKKSMQADEVVEALEVPRPHPQQRFRTYKLAKRYDSDISAVCAAFNVRLDGERIVDSRVAFGGMAATACRAPRCEAALNGKAWNEATARAAMAALSEDYSPLSDMRASAAYRSRTAANLLYRFYLETRAAQPLSSQSLNVFENSWSAADLR